MSEQMNELVVVCCVAAVFLITAASRLNVAEKVCPLDVGMF